MSMPDPGARPLTAPRRRLTPLTLAAVLLLAAAAAWLVLQILLQLLGIATSPVGWLLSGIGALASVFSARG
ncbi:MAG: hypothetical protein KGJ75_12155 [Alphaproteobacteria bacterium]|nr:hypothetical protein [Alphaproteobacteria bacterium]MDE2013668.1 hypothetical protein [Alphaproteobacteria bacterium]